MALMDRFGDSGSPVTSGVAGVSAAPTGDDGSIQFLRPSTVLTTVSSVLVRHQAEAEATVPSQPAATEAAEGDEATPEPSRAPEPKAAFFTYTVQPGDTVSSIATSFGIDPAYITWNNPEIGDPDLLLVGAKVLIPSTNGLVYHVALGDTLVGIADYYQIDVQNIVGFVPNGIDSPDAVSEGMVLVLPGATPPPPPIPAAVEIVEETIPTPVPEPAGPVPAAEPPQPVSPAISGFVWPFYGNITTYFGEPRGAGYHKGIDIDGFGAYGAPIGSAAGGTVILAAWDDWGLGYHVKVRHADGSITVYAHLSEIWVTQGQVVGQGEAVGALGSSGYSTGPHLHFELWVGGIPVDPLLYLP